MSVEGVSPENVPDGYEELFTQDVEVVERYNASEFAEVIILYNERKGKYLYYVNEPDISDYEVVKTDLTEYIPFKLTNEGFTPEGDSDEERREHLRERVRELGRKRITKQEVVTAQIQNRLAGLASNLYEKAEKYKVDVFDEEIIQKILYYVERDLIKNGKIQPITDDPYVEDIHGNSSETPVYVIHSEYGGESNLLTNITYSKEELDNIILSWAQETGKIVSASNPIVNGSLRDGTRININYADEVTDGGSSFVLRLFDDEPMNPIDLIKYKTFSPEQMAYFWLAVENEKSIMFVGGTASGKTTSMNAVARFIPDDYKFVSIEDTREVQINSDNWTKNVTRDSVTGEVGEIGMFELLTDSLRKRPNYIIVGEVRGSEAQTLFEAMNTGHATLSTFHAENVKSARERLTGDKLDVPIGSIPPLDVMTIQQRTSVDNDVVRRAESIEEIDNIEQDQINYSTMYEYDYSSDEMERQKRPTQSDVLGDVKVENGWSEEELKEELDNRKKVLEQMVEEDITDNEDVDEIIQLYMRRKEYVLDLVESEESILSGIYE